MSFPIATKERDRGSMVFSGANAKVYRDRNGLFVIGTKVRLSFIVSTL